LDKWPEDAGGLLEFVLDAESLLKESDQGRTFYGFVNLILSPGRQEKLRQLVDEIHQVPDLASCEEGLEMLSPNDARPHGRGRAGHADQLSKALRINPPPS